MQEITVSSSDKLELNLTYGMAVTIRDIKNRILDKTFKIDEEVQNSLAEKERDIGGPVVISLDSDSDDALRRQDMLMKSSNYHSMRSTNLKLMKKKAGYRFINYTGAPIKFCASSRELNDDLGFNNQQVYSIKRLSNVKRAQNKVADYLVEMYGSINNIDGLGVEFRDIKYFRK
mmetsp:Transcript_18162/g.27939  ORF Transcript_18162/g.27939 Transcript_18162/m.27939 type:complete len:174 (+) Transcript_18162:5808-6329(+)